MTFWESITIFLASLISIAYEMLRKAQDTINRKTMLVKLLGAVTTLVALGTTKLIWNSSQSKWYKIS